MSVSCLKNLKAGDVIHARGVYYDKRFKITHILPNVIKAINLANNVEVYISTDSLARIRVFKIVKAK